MKQASGNQGPLAPGNQAGHLRRESSHSAQNDMGNQGPNAQGRGGFPPQGGRGRGGFNPQNQYQQQQMGYPPPAGQPFRNQQNAGRGGMPPPFQGQGRPINAPFPNSPHQPARSPALTNSMPGTPNMNQVVPMQNQPQYYNSYAPHMQGPQVNHQSSSAHNRLDFSNSNRGGKAKNWRKNEQYSKGQRSSEQSKELYGHSYSPLAPPYQPISVTESYGHDPRIAQIPLEQGAPDVYMLDEQSKASVPTSPLNRRPSADRPGYPPLPTPIPSPISFPPPSVGLHNMDVARVLALDISPEGGGFDQFLTSRQQQNYGGYPPQFNDRMMPMQNMQGAQFMYPQMQFMHPPPQSPQPGYQQPNAAYVPGQYGPLKLNPCPEIPRRCPSIDQLQAWDNHRHLQ